MKPFAVCVFVPSSSDFIIIIALFGAWVLFSSSLKRYNCNGTNELKQAEQTNFVYSDRLFES